MKTLSQLYPCPAIAKSFSNLHATNFKWPTRVMTQKRQNRWPTVGDKYKTCPHSRQHFANFSLLCEGRFSMASALLYVVLQSNRPF